MIPGGAMRLSAGTEPREIESPRKNGREQERTAEGKTVDIPDRYQYVIVCTGVLDICAHCL